MNYYGMTNIGKLRQNNEDNFIAQTIWDGNHILCAAIDGIGGNDGGKVASEIVHNTIVRHFENFRRDDLSECLQNAIVDANNEVIRFQRAMAKYREMGCVMSIGIIDCARMVLRFKHIGDTRIYSLQGKRLCLLTQDASIGNILTNYIGRHFVPYGEPLADTSIIQLQTGTKLLFCTDGLWKMIDERNLSSILLEQVTPDKTCEHLIIEANKNGGIDNITAVVVNL